MNKEIAIKAGLTPSGTDEDGNTEYIGTKQQWNEYEQLQIKLDTEIHD